MKIGLHRKTMVAALLAVSTSIGVGAAAAQKVQVNSAVWLASRNELRIEGIAARPDEVVLVRDAATKAFVGGAAVRRDGRWVLKVWAPKSIPARVRVEALGASAEATVERPRPSR